MSLNMYETINMVFTRFDVYENRTQPERWSRFSCSHAVISMVSVEKWRLWSSVANSILKILLYPPNTMVDHLYRHTRRHEWWEVWEEIWLELHLVGKDLRTKYLIEHKNSIEIRLSSVVIGICMYRIRKNYHRHL